MRTDKGGVLPHTIKSELMSRQVQVHLIGCGGTGSQMLTHLSRLHLSLIGLGHPAGLHVTAYDPDRVSESNIGRQLFAPSDKGDYKACVLINRLNLYFNDLRWEAKPERYINVLASRVVYINTPDIVITCVDSIASRREIEAELKYRARGTSNPFYWLDCGNAEATGQVFLTQVVDQKKKQEKGWKSGMLPSMRDVLPELFDPALEAEDSDLPSCSLAEALERQNLVINGTVATMGLNLLWNLFRDGGLLVHGYWINLATGHVLPVPVPVRAK